MEPTVFIKPVEGNLTDCIQECFDKFGGTDSIVKGNVFIKINCTFPQKGAITDPAVVEAAVKVIKESPKVKKIYVFDNTAVGCFTRAVFLIDNLSKRVKKAGGKPLYLDEQKSIIWDYKGKVLGKIPVPKILVENLIKRKNENTYINIPKLKTHTQTNVTICIKNQHGLLYDDQKIFSHHLMDQKLIDIMSVFKPDFNIVDAVEVCDYGAVPFRPEWVIPMKLLLAGKDPVAVDTIGSKLIGRDKPLAKHILMAAENGFGCSNFDKINVVPSKDIIERYKIQLHSEDIPIGAKDIILIKGNEKNCITGCVGLGEYLRQLVADIKHTSCVCISGKGHEEHIKELDKSTGPFIVTGPCAVQELKGYFESRKDRKKMKVFYLNDHFDITGLVSVITKAANVSIMALSKRFPFGMSRLILSFMNAKLHGVRCRFI